jgi:putative ATPase subunit of terminase (gpP-like)
MDIDNLTKRFDAYVKSSCKYSLIEEFKKRNKITFNVVSLSDMNCEDIEYSEDGFLLVENNILVFNGRAYTLVNEELYSAITKLPVKLKTVVVSTYFEGKTAKQIAQMLNVTDRTIKNYKKNALNQIKETMLSEKT